MTLSAVDSDRVAARLTLMRPHLDERAWRLSLGGEAKVLGRGGIKLVAVAGGVHPDTVAAGVRELDSDEPIPGRVRRPGAGRPAMAVSDPLTGGAAGHVRRRHLDDQVDQALCLTLVTNACVLDHHLSRRHDRSTTRRGLRDQR